MSRRAVGSIRWRSDHVARVELSAGRDPITGKRRRMSCEVHGNQADAERALARMLLAIGRLPAGKSLTVAGYLETLYLPSLDARVRKSTRYGYVQKLNQHVVPRLGSVILTELEPYVLDAWRDELVAKMSGRNALHVYRVFATALNRAVKWRLIPSNPLDAVDPPKAQERTIETLSTGEAVAYLKAFDGHRLAPIVIMALGAGLRPCELYGLRWSDLDLGAGTVRVERGLHQRKAEVWEEPPKSARSHRVVSLPAWVIEALRPYRGLGALVSDERGAVVPNVIAKLYARQIRSVGLRYVPLRDLRHTHATLMLQAGVDVVVVSRRLGHSNVAITDRHYLRPKRSADQAAADKLDELLASNGVRAGVASPGVPTVPDLERR